MENKLKNDKHFNLFLKNFGPPAEGRKIGESSISRFENFLPSQIFAYWRVFGECGFGGGLIWMVDPSKYHGILKAWLVGSRFEERKGLSVIARNAFGSLDVWEKGKGHILSIDPLSNTIFYLSENDGEVVSSEEEDRKIRSFWAFLHPEDLDESDENGKPLFQRALAKLGPLEEDEMFGYSSRRQLGGPARLENLEKYKIDVYHDISVQFGEIGYVNLG